MNHDQRVLWEWRAGEGTTACLMVSCCAGAELQVVRFTDAGQEEILLRELYPDRDALYERARALRLEMARDSGLTVQDL